MHARLVHTCGVHPHPEPPPQLHDGYSESDFESEYESVDEALEVASLPRQQQEEQEGVEDHAEVVVPSPHRASPAAAAASVAHGAAQPDAAKPAQEEPAAREAESPAAQGEPAAAPSSEAAASVDTAESVAEAAPLTDAVERVDGAQRDDDDDNGPIVLCLGDDDGAIACPHDSTAPAADPEAPELGLHEVIEQVGAPASSPEEQAAAVADQLMHALVCEAVEAMRPKAPAVRVAAADPLLPSAVHGAP